MVMGRNMIKISHRDRPGGVLQVDSSLSDVFGVNICSQRPGSAKRRVRAQSNIDSYHLGHTLT